MTNVEELKARRRALYHHADSLEEQLDSVRCEIANLSLKIEDAPPPKASCRKCGVTDVKLWREHGVYSEVRILCITHAAQQADVPLTDILPDGRHITEFGPTYEYAWYVPANQVSNSDGLAWWSNFTMNPDAAKDFENWLTLPLGLKDE